MNNRQNFKTVFVKACFRSYEKNTFLGLGSSKKTYSDCAIDSELLSHDTERELQNLSDNGYEIISVTPITSGNYLSGANGWGVGYSFTDGVMISAKKAKDNL
jgi:hypothetical protein